MASAMKRSVLLILFVALLGARRAHAEESKDRPPHVFALVIANNRSTQAAQPDLQYADDDGARYYQLFQALGRASDIVLLTSFDRATRANYGSLTTVARAPTHAALLAARDQLSSAVRAARARGERTVLYLVFAGHGEVVEGRGLLDLEDRQIDGAFLERELITQIPADTKHVILDSCNSFFVMNPRKPGGRRWATPKDMAFGFSARYPDVGLFLSTNSESEVYEWSELESGVFSHEVRSGLRGAADVNQDGAVSYLELAGFIARANLGIVRESLRPQLFYRGPQGDPHATLLPVSALRGRRVVMEERKARMWLKTYSGERLLDLHKEPGPMTLVLPEEVGELLVYEQRAGATGGVALTEQSAAAGDTPLQLASLEPRAPGVSARGSRIFGQLFERPYGPLALAAYVEEQAQQTEPVFGVSAAQVAHTRSYMVQFAAEGRSRRMLEATAMIGFGGVGLSAGVALAAQPDGADRRPAIFGLSGLSAALIGAGLYRAIRPSTSERVLEGFDRELRSSPQDAAQTLVKAEHSLDLLAARERRMREALFWVYQAGAVGYATMGTLALTERDADRALNATVWYTGAALFSALGIALRFMSTPTERLLNLYRADPGVKLHLAGEVGHAAASVGLAGSF